MGFSSFKSALSGKDIFNVYREDKHEGICIVFPDDTFVFGDYDGYCRVSLKSMTIDIWVIVKLKGDLDRYFKIAKDSELFESIRREAISDYYNGNMIIKAITEREMIDTKDADMAYDKLNASKPAEGHGYWG
jgi:hypothetical protein